MDPVETPSPKKQKKPENRRWHRIRTTARWCRVATLLLVLTAVIFGVFLNKVGLPVWVEKRIQAQLRSKGWDMSFSRLRVRWHRGIVADHLQLHRTGATNGPHVFVRTAELPLNWRALTSFRLEPRFSVLRQGLLVWPLGGTNKPQRTFVLKNISGKLIFKPHDVWELNYLEGDLLGAHVRFQGELTNATQIGRWAMSPSLKAKQTGTSSFWHRLLTEVESMRFDGQPSLTVTFTGDALDLRTLGGTVKLLAAGVDSKRARGTNFTVTGNLTPSSQAAEGA
jgi:hypothetical protein